MDLSDGRLRAVTDRLAAAGCVAAGEEAAELVTAAPDQTTLDRWVARRADGEPTAWIVGATIFGERSLDIAPGVYVPRLQTEELARRAATRLPPLGRALDLCAGAGAVAAHLAAASPGSTVVAVDIDPHAAACARRNGVAAWAGDLAAAIDPSARFDVITAVTPYVPSGEMRLLPADVRRFEPRRALDGGADGLDLVRRVIDAARQVLRPGGWLLLEIGGDQDAAAGAAMSEAGFESIVTWRDDEGDLRGIEGRCA